MADKIALACDHRGYEAKESIRRMLVEQGWETVDCGAFSGESCDYPDFMIPAAESVSRGDCRYAIGICHSGIGSAIIANKVRGVRAALCKNTEEAGLSKQHNDANMLILGAGFLTMEEILAITGTWLKTPFEGGRHERRVDKIREYEQNRGA